jgi:hypothetical protein
VNDFPFDFDFTSKVPRSTGESLATGYLISIAATRNSTSGAPSLQMEFSRTDSLPALLTTLIYVGYVTLFYFIFF